MGCALLAARSVAARGSGRRVVDLHGFFLEEKVSTNALLFSTMLATAGGIVARRPSMSEDHVTKR